MTHKFRLMGLLTPALLMSTALTAHAAGDARLAEAVKQRNLKEARLLLQNRAQSGVQIDGALGDGTTALHWAAFNADLEAVRLLLANGANPNAKTRLGAITPLSLACVNGDAAIIAALLKGGADVNAQTSTGVTPLMTAATSGSVAAVDTLLEHGANLNAKETVHGQTALMFAAVKNRPEVIRDLVRRGADWKITSTVEKIGTQRFDEDGNPIASGAGANGTPRRRPPNAAGANSNDSNPSDSPRQQSPNPAAALALARRASAVVIGGNTALTLAARDGQLAAIRALLESGADVNQPSAGDQTTPIVTAICNGHYDVAKFLLDHGADPNLASVDGLAALYAVIDTQWAPVGWAPNPITDQEQTTYLDLMKALLAKGAKPNTQLTKKLWFRPTHHDECWIGSAGATPFWRAAQATDLAAMRLLVAHGADPKIATNEGDNALMVASGLGWNGNFSTQGPDSSLNTVKYCLELGLDPTPQDVQGYTALAGAAYRGDNELIHLLVSKGAKLDTRNTRGWSVTDMANAPSLRSSVPVAHPYTVALLLKLGAPPLTPLDGEEILGIIRKRPGAANGSSTNSSATKATSDKSSVPDTTPATKDKAK